MYPPSPTQTEERTLEFFRHEPCYVVDPETRAFPGASPFAATTCRTATSRCDAFVEPLQQVCNASREPVPRGATQRRRRNSKTLHGVR